MLRVKTDEAIVSVVAMFPFGTVKKLRYLEEEDTWQTRFLAPKDLVDGTYNVRLILRDKQGRRAVNGATEKFQVDPHWRDLLQFFEYFHGDTGAGLGANHQTGWTGIIARLMHLFATTTPEQALELGKSAAVRETTPPPKKPTPRIPVVQRASRP